jgi:hypothetical protein
MKIFKLTLIFLISIFPGGALRAQLQLRDIYSCLVPLGNLEYLSIIQQNALSLEETKSKQYPSLQLQFAKDYNATNSPSTSSSAYARLAASQSVYDRKIGTEINVEEARVDSVRYSAMGNKLTQIHNAIDIIGQYYLLKEKFKIIEQKIQRQTGLISVLRDMVAAKSTDGVLLTLSESDLSLLKIRSAELGLQIQRIEKSFFVPEKLKKLILDDTIFKLASKSVDQRTYKRQADKTALLSWEFKKKEIELNNLSLVEALYPKLNFGLDYYTYFEERSGLKPKDDFLLSVSLTIPLSDLYTVRLQQASQMKSLQYAQMAIDKSRFDINVEDQYNLDRLKQINQSVQALNSVKLNIIKAKDVISKKLLVNKASYNDYIQIDDRVDEVEEQISSNEIEKTKLLMINEVNSFFSNESTNSGFSCSL